MNRRDYGDSSLILVAIVTLSEKPVTTGSSRIVIRTQNNINVKLRTDNSSGVTGVNWDMKSNQWVVRISVNKKRIYLGRYNSFEDAVKVRKQAEENYFGEWSYDDSQRV